MQGTVFSTGSINWGINVLPLIIQARHIGKHAAIAECVQVVVGRRGSSQEKQTQDPGLEDDSACILSNEDKKGKAW